MEKLMQFIADNGETYGVNMSMVMTVLAPEEMENLGNQGEKAMHITICVARKNGMNVPKHWV